MLRSLGTLQKAFEDRIEKSRKECEKELDELRKLIFRVEKSFVKSIDECCVDRDEVTFKPKFHNSLAFSRLFELFFDVSTNILALCFCGVYRDASIISDTFLSHLFKPYT